MDLTMKKKIQNRTNEKDTGGVRDSYINDHHRLAKYHRDHVITRDANGREKDRINRKTFRNFPVKSKGSGVRCRMAKSARGPPRDDFGIDRHISVSVKVSATYVRFVVRLHGSRPGPIDAQTPLAVTSYDPTRDDGIVGATKPYFFAIFGHRDYCLDGFFFFGTRYFC